MSNKHTGHPEIIKRLKRAKGLSVFKCFARVLRFSRREALARFLF